MKRPACKQGEAEQRAEMAEAGWSQEQEGESCLLPQDERDGEMGLPPQYRIAIERALVQSTREMNESSQGMADAFDAARKECSAQGIEPTPA